MSSMVMFSRALEIAYEDHKNFAYSNIQDIGVIRKIRSKPKSKALFEKIVYSDFFLPLSNSYPELIEAAWKIYNRHVNEKMKFKETKLAIESKIAELLTVNLDKETVICHVYNPLIWESGNIQLQQSLGIERSAATHFWKLDWDISEGTLAAEPKIEVFVSSLSNDS